MKISQIKKIYEKIPSWMTVPVAPLIRSRLTENHEFRETYAMLEQWDKMSREEREKKQLQKLRETLVHAQKACPYYRNLFASCGLDPRQFASAEELKKLPLLTRQIVQDHREEITAEDISDYYEVTTGGSTGSPLAISMEKKAIYREWAFVYHYWSRFGYDFRKDRIATFRALDLQNKIAVANPLYQELRMNPYLLNKNTVETFHRKIKAFGADFLYGYPSLLYNFCRLAEENGCLLKGQYRAVFLVSENLYPFQEQTIRRVLGCPIAIFYGHTERAAFAERDTKGYLFHPLYGILQMEGDIPTVTGFINEKTPLIRYALDDTFELQEDGRWKIEGHRNSDCLIGRNGEQFRATMLDFHGSLTDELGNFQLEQTAPGKVFLCVKRGGADSRVAEKVCNECREKLGDGFELELRWVEELQYTARGKYRFLVQHMKD